jgi:hypothetical protein
MAGIIPSNKRNWVDCGGIAVHIVVANGGVVHYEGEANVIVRGNGGVEHCQPHPHSHSVGMFILPQLNQQNKTKQLGWCGIIIGKKTTTTTTPHHTTPDVITFHATSRQPRKQIFGMQPYSNPTRRYMEYDLNIVFNGRQPQIFQMTTTSNFSNEDDLKKDKAT